VKNQKIPVDFEALKSEFCKLKEAFDVFDFGAINEIVENLQKIAQVSEVEETLESILQNTIVGKYEDAVVAIDTLLGEVK